MTFAEERYGKDPAWKALTEKIEEERETIREIRAKIIAHNVPGHIVPAAYFQERDAHIITLNHLCDARRYYEAALNDYEHEFEHFGTIRGTKL